MLSRCCFSVRFEHMEFIAGVVLANFFNTLLYWSPKAHNSGGAAMKRIVWSILLVWIAVIGLACAIAMNSV